MEMFEVGGCVRDELLGRKSDDIDFTVVLPPVEGDPFLAMKNRLLAQGFTIFVETPEFLTIRARFPKNSNHPVMVAHRASRTKASQPTADFVLARAESDYKDGRRPSKVTPGTLMDDLARRDFTMNAMARGADGEIIDPFNGRLALLTKVIECVGDPVERIINEDALRGLRAIRFAVTLGFTIAPDVQDVLKSLEFREALRPLPIERVFKEMHKAFRHDSVFTIQMLQSVNLLSEVLRDGMWLEPTTRK